MNSTYRETGKNTISLSNLFSFVHIKQRKVPDSMRFSPKRCLCPWSIITYTQQMSVVSQQLSTLLPFLLSLLLPAYVVWWEGNSFTISLFTGGGQVQPAGGVGGSGPAEGGVRSSWQGGVRSSWWGGSGPADRGGSGPVGGGGVAKIGQQNEYSLHGGRYASCVHAGGLSCCLLSLESYLIYHPNNLQM